MSRAWCVLAIKIVPKMSHRAPFCCTFWRVGSKVSFSLLFVWFSRGSDPRSARAGAVETQFFILGVASKRVSILHKLLKHSWYIWRRNTLKNTSKSSLKTGAVKVSLFCFLAVFLHPVGHLMVRLSCLWGVSSLKEARFSRAWGPWTRKRWCLVSSGATYHVFLSRSGA